MAHPKRRQSKSRQAKRRTHDKIAIPQLAKDPKTGQYHIYHKAYWHENKLYYRGKVVLEKKSKESLKENISSN
jgi:large subunit ribosomal protein L32